MLRIIFLNSFLLMTIELCAQLSSSFKFYFDELRVGNSLNEVSLYGNSPKIFSQRENLDFIKNHK